MYYCDRCAAPLPEGHKAQLDIFQTVTTVWNQEKRYRLCKHCTVQLFIFLEENVD